MDKYVLVPSEQYRKGSTASSRVDDSVGGKASSSASPVPPPPGLPKRDSLAVRGVQVSISEAKDINEQLKKFQSQQSIESGSDDDEDSEKGGRGVVSDNWELWRESWTST